MANEFYANNDGEVFPDDEKVEYYQISNVNRGLVMAALRSVGCTMVRINFSGGGDDGQIDDDIDFQGITNDPKNIPVDKIKAVRDHSYMENGQWVRVPAGKEIPSSGNLHTMLTEFADDIVGGDFPYDWCNNDGGSGTIVIKPGEAQEDGTLGTITVFFTQNITSTQDFKLSC